MDRNDSTTSGATNCSGDPETALKQIFIDSTMGKRALAGQSPVRRAVFLKPHGVVKCTFTVVPDLPPKYKIGIFAGSQYNAWVRFSSDTVPGDSDLKNTVGIGIKLFGVGGKKMLPGEENGLTADFLLQNSDVFFVDTAQDMCEFTQASTNIDTYQKYLEDHPTTKRILDEMQKIQESCLRTTFWSSLPYSFGSEHVKYKLLPIQPQFVVPRPQIANDYLRLDLQLWLIQKEAQFKFMVQFRTEPDKMPLDKATVRWSEIESPPVHFATLLIQRQDISAQGQDEYGENLSFNPWRTLEIHSPQGSIGEVRKSIYQAGASFRRFRNGIPEVEPKDPRSLSQI
jgi:hypothetical protein